MEFAHITACGECCAVCEKRHRGLCGGCNEMQGRCEEWAQSGQCPAYACTREHGVLFCGLCAEFPCDHLPMQRWRPDCVRELTELAAQYRSSMNGLDAEQLKDDP